MSDIPSLPPLPPLDAATPTCADVPAQAAASVDGLNLPSGPGADAAASSVMEPAPPIPTAAPPASNSRSLVRQSSRSFAARTGTSTGKEKDVAESADTVPASPAAGSSSTPVLTPSVEVAYTQIGLTAPPLSETAAQARSRINLNEGKLAVYATSLEAGINSLTASAMRRDDDLLRALDDHKVAFNGHIRVCAAQDLSGSPAFRALHSAVADDRGHITALAGLPQQVATLRAEVNALMARGPVTASAPAAPVPALPALPPVIASSPAAVVPARRSLPEPSGPPPKRANTERGDTDVIYGPVNSKLVPVTAAKGAMAFVDGLHARDVQNARPADRRPGYISIRFASAAKAAVFVAAVRDRPFIADQVAVFASSVSDRDEQLTLDMLRASDNAFSG